MNENCCLCKCSIELFFFIDFWQSQKCNFHRFAVCFQAFINITRRSTQNAKRIKRFLRLHIVIKPLITNRLYKFFITVKLNSFKISSQIWRLSEVRAGWPYRWFWKFFWTVSLIKSAPLLRWRQVQKSDRINSDRQSGSDQLGSTRTDSDRIKK